MAASNTLRPLASSVLRSLGASGVAVPTYDRSKISVGIVHFGVGGFHRAHQAMYLDRLMNNGAAQDWGICGVGVMPFDRKMNDIMKAQDNLYTLLVKHADGRLEARVIGSIVQYLFAPADPNAVVEKLADPKVRIVSLTVTEGGYNFHAVTGNFDPTHEGVMHDLQAPNHSRPRTTFGLVTEALVRRRERGIPPFSILSCDNIAGNGEVARRSFAAFARLRNEELGDYVEKNVAFPNSMVDRITPVTTDDDRELVEKTFGIKDAWPVTCEPFTQWVLEDSLPERPPFEQAGAQVVRDVIPYELMKLRLLNASHQALAYFGYLCGYRLVHDAVRDPLIARFLRAYMDDEATPTLPPVPGIDLDAYKSTLIERFQNSNICDQVVRLCAETTDRIPKWLLPIIRQNLDNAGKIKLSAAIVASWARYAECVDEDGQRYTIVDRFADRVIANAAKQDTDPLAFVKDREFFGDVAQNELFASAYLATRKSLKENGARKTLEALLDERETA